MNNKGNKERRVEKVEAVKIKEIAQALSGLKAYEWSSVKIAVERMYSSEAAKAELPGTEEIQKNISNEIL